MKKLSNDKRIPIGGYLLMALVDVIYQVDYSDWLLILSFKNFHRKAELQGMYARRSQAREEVETLYEEDEDKHNDTLCGACDENYALDEFWICCDICEKWFHGKFVV
ncbi:PHD finger protein ALFIN-LIKE 3-like isoform X1 [Cucumis melo var. makuwa]|uniref:PHD finger protein ALFIN-LIKE n=1 Tax=Cucumis melo var. makuwa TaxID=1194695 RepID=A0A5D3BW61_CUCMM|nr:PHD finger protein ALFIN-LIKE 3-like isoform X1 [Cucumis melo var. makuwa]TYK03364.1 PHD finger protein ALFIN-LIKE 3-like isoform X1 [Cucumis melo var. makuwa]